MYIDYLSADAKRDTSANMIKRVRLVHPYAMPQKESLFTYGLCVPKQHIDK